MFTGIVEIIGVVSKLDFDGPAGGTSLTISGASSILVGCREGDSISVNGTCLTVVSFTADAFVVGVAPETLRRTNLGQLRKDGKVNLERAVAADTRMGGHFVQGHVDTTAEILSITPDGNALTFRLQPRHRSILRYVIEKGYVAVDGASLTVTKVNDKEGWWEVMLIAYTQEKIVTATKVVGEDVNIEVDQIAKYVEKCVHGYLESAEGNGGVNALQKMVDRTVEEKLKCTSHRTSG